MLESFCRPKIYDKCIKVTGSEPLCWLKGQQKPEWDYEGFYAPGQIDKYIVFDTDLYKRINRSKTGRKAASLFSRKGDVICEGYINEVFGNWETAINQLGTFNNLAKGFEEYFEERKKQFMEKTEDIIAKLPKQITKSGTIRTNSHGGVANLLKVLTRTMHEQGSSIRTIAKVQYAVCTQAGIFIPDEFITDVLTAADINPDVIKEE